MELWLSEQVGLLESIYLTNQRLMEETRIKPERRTSLRRPWERGDHAFSLVSIAVILFMVIAGFAAWMFGNPVRLR
jgi:hypothetical protein